MKLQPIIYTKNTAAAVDWYTRVLGTEPGYRSDMWTSFGAGDATLGIHLVEALPPEGRVALSLVATEPLEALVDRLQAAGVEPVEPIREQPFGRSVLFRDPDGTPVQINEHAHS